MVSFNAIILWIVSFIFSFCLSFTNISSPVYRTIDNTNPDGTYLFKVKNRNTRTMCEVCLKLKINTLEQRLMTSL